MIYRMIGTSGRSSSVLSRARMHGAGRHSGFKAGDFNAKQICTHSAFTAIRNSPQARILVNTSIQSDIMWLPSLCLAWRTWQIAWFWTEENHSGAINISGMLWIYSLLVLVFIQSRQVIEPFKASLASLLTSCVLFKPVTYSVVCNLTVLSIMPRLRGICRRGSHSGTRGQSS